MRVEVKYSEKTELLLKQAHDARERCLDAIVKRFNQNGINQGKINEIIYTDPYYLQITKQIENIYKLSIPDSIEFLE